MGQVSRSCAPDVGEQVSPARDLRSRRKDSAIKIWLDHCKMTGLGVRCRSVGKSKSKCRPGVPGNFWLIGRAGYDSRGQDTSMICGSIYQRLMRWRAGIEFDCFRLHDKSSGRVDFNFAEYEFLISVQ